MKSFVIETTSLDSNSLEALFEDKAYILIVRNYVEPSICRKYGELISVDENLEKYFYEVSDGGERKSIFLGVSRYGVSFSTTFGKSPDSFEKKRYYDLALPNIKRIRNLFHPNLSPIDKLRLELDEQYPYGANLASFEEKKMFSGIARITHKDLDLQEKNPHVDSLPPGFSIEKQFSANIYLSTPSIGGELIVYPMEPLSAAEVDDFEANQKLWSSKLPEGIHIKPNDGDLILINTRRPHAVTKFVEGTRVSLQSFIGINKYSPLQLWC